MARNAQEQFEIENVLKTATEAAYSGRIKSVAVLFLDTDNQVQMTYHISEGDALLMMGLTKLFDASVASFAIKKAEPKDYI